MQKTRVSHVRRVAIRNDYVIPILSTIGGRLAASSFCDIFSAYAAHADSDCCSKSTIRGTHRVLERWNVLAITLNLFCFQPVLGLFFHSVTSISASTKKKLERLAKPQTSKIIKNAKMRKSNAKENRQELLRLWSMNKKALYEARRFASEKGKRSRLDARFHPRTWLRRWSHRETFYFAIFCSFASLSDCFSENFYDAHISISENSKVMYAYCSNLFRC